MTPIVSFVVPCYKLAHLLRECIESILSQTYSDFEVLIMDDCSPDNTPEVAQLFRDPRVKYIRNDSNLGHLRNYNRGISLARGKYVWLISADDYLRLPYVLQRYVELLDRHPRVGYVFCPAVGVRNGLETGLVKWAIHWDDDRVIAGHDLLKELLGDNKIVAACGMARRECYERINFFPLNMPWAGDWYLWCVFAVYFDVGYFAEPMVCYRDHDLSMTEKLMEGQVEQCVAEYVEMPWAIKRKADDSGYRGVSKDCLCAAANLYIRSMTARSFPTSSSYWTSEQFEESVCRNTASESERNWVRARVYAAIADGYYGRGELASAKQFYLTSLRRDPWRPKILTKWFLLSLGKPGCYLRTTLRSLRQDRMMANPAQSHGRSS